MTNRCPVCLIWLAAYVVGLVPIGLGIRFVILCWRGL